MASKYMTNVELAELVNAIANSIVSGLDFIGSVNEIYTAAAPPPVSPNDKDRIIFNNTSPSGWDIDTNRDGTGNGVQPNDGDVLEYNSNTSLWERLVNVTEVDADGNKKAEGAFTWIEDEDRFVVYNGNSWVDFFGLEHLKDGSTDGSILSRNGYSDTLGALEASGLFSVSLGDQTTVQSSHSTIAGGYTNSITGTDSEKSFIGSGSNNVINGIGFSTIISGSNNTIIRSSGTADINYSGIVAGYNNSITSDAVDQGKNIIAGGEYNELEYVNFSGIFTGQSNKITGVSGNSNYSSSAILSGGSNEINENLTGTLGSYSSIVSGYSNLIHGDVDRSLICTGSSNKIERTSSSLVSTDENIIGAGDGNLIQNAYQCGILTGSGNDIYGSSSTFNGTFDCAIVSGSGNQISSNSTSASTFYSAILTGTNNTINPGSRYSSIIAGSYNVLSGETNFSAIISGTNNQITTSSNSNFIGSGNLNSIDLDGGSGPGGSASIVGGNFNKIYSRPDYNFIGGGSSNVIRNQGYSAIVAGSGNQILSGDLTSADGVPSASFYNGIVTGQNNKIYKGAGNYVFIGGGYLNTIEGDNAGTVNTSEYSSILGGDSNTITSSKYAAILGGDSNTITSSSLGSYGTVIVGGKSNTINPAGDNQGNIISAGESNTIGGNNATYSGIFAGYNNDISPNGASNSSVILSGTLNQMSASSSIDYCAIVSGENNEITGTAISNNFIGSGYSNLIAAAINSSIIGGYDNTINVSSHSAIVSGYLNEILTNSTRSGILTGENNSISTSSTSCAIMSGLDNSITLSEKSAIVSGGDDGTGTFGNLITSSDYSIIGAGLSNRIELSNYSFIGSGAGNNIYNTSGISDNNVIAGGGGNNIYSTSGTTSYNVIAGGGGNDIYDTSGTTSYNVIAGGGGNNIYDTSDHNVIAGGGDNNIYDTSDHNVIAGGGGNNISLNSIYCIINGGGNTIDGSNSSAILGSGNTINGKNFAYVFGGGINAFEANATFIDNIYGRGGAYQFQHLYLSHTGNVINPKLLVTFDNTTNTITKQSFTVSYSNNMYEEGTPILFSDDGTLPSELNTNTTYYIINVSGSDFQISETIGGSAVSFTDNGSGDTYLTIESKNSFGSYLNEQPFLSKYDATIGDSGGYELVFNYRIKANGPRQIDIIERNEYTPNTSTTSLYSRISGVGAAASAGGTLTASSTYYYIVYPVFLIDGTKYAARSHGGAVSATTDATNRSITLQYDLHDNRNIDHIEIVRYDSVYGTANAGKLKMLPALSGSLNNSTFVDDGTVAWDDISFTVQFASWFRYGLVLPEPSAQLAGTVYEIQDYCKRVVDSEDSNATNESYAILITCENDTSGNGSLRLVGNDIYNKYTAAFLDNEINSPRLKAMCIFEAANNTYAWLLDGDLATNIYDTL